MTMAAEIAETPVADREEIARIVPHETSGYAVADDVIVLSEPGSVRAEAIGALRTHIIAQHLPAGRRSLALCAPNANVGCTALAVNLAVLLAESGLKTLLIDGDLREPALHRFIVPPHAAAGMGPGLADVLADPSLDLGSAIRAEVKPNLSLMYAGAQPEKPQDLLASPRFSQLANACLRDFDVTIVDTPPSNLSADARRIAAVISYALIVVGKDKTFVNDVRVLSDELQADHVVVIGCALNKP